MRKQAVLSRRPAEPSTKFDAREVFPGPVRGSSRRAPGCSRSLLDTRLAAVGLLPSRFTLLAFENRRFHFGAERLHSVAASVLLASLIPRLRVA